MPCKCKANIRHETWRMKNGLPHALSCTNNVGILNTENPEKAFGDELGKQVRVLGYKDRVSKSWRWQTHLPSARAPNLPWYGMYLGA
eukprot:scaffold55680_cov18-Tisochrysis_lutea.AAC.1